MSDGRDRPATNGVDVLLVEDEPVILMVASDMLSDAGYRVRECGSAEEAIAAMTDGYRPHVLIADNSLPGISGTDLAIQVRDCPVLAQEDRAPAILIATGDTASAQALFPVLAKPYREEQLLDTVRSLLETV